MQLGSTLTLNCMQCYGVILDEKFANRRQKKRIKKMNVDEMIQALEKEIEERKQELAVLKRVKKRMMSDGNQMALHFARKENKNDRRGMGSLAEEILLEQKKPMHATNEILPILSQRYAGEIKASSLIPALRRNRRIKQTGPNTFIHTKWAVFDSENPEAKT